MWNALRTWRERMWEASHVVLPPYNNKAPNPFWFLIRFQSIAKDFSIAEKPQTITEGEVKAEAPLLLPAAGEAFPQPELTVRTGSAEVLVLLGTSMAFTSHVALLGWRWGQAHRLWICDLLCMHGALLCWGLVRGPFSSSWVNICAEKILIVFPLGVALEACAPASKPPSLRAGGMRFGWVVRLALGPAGLRGCWRTSPCSCSVWVLIV